MIYMVQNNEDYGVGLHLREGGFSSPPSQKQIAKILFFMNCLCRFCSLYHFYHL
jgi:hypothetical protein